MAPEWPRALVWFREFLKQELSPYPGRMAVAARMVLAAAIMMLIYMTFRIPDATYGALFVLVLSREDQQATLNAVKTAVNAFILSAIFILVGAMVFAGDPTLRLLWVITALFAMFFGLSAMANYAAAARFGWMTVIAIPIWDQHITAEAKVEGTLWIVGTFSLASALTAVIEVVFEASRPSNDLFRSIGERLTTVKDMLTPCAEGRPVDENITNHLTRLSMLGTSRLRRVLQRSATSQDYGEQMGLVVALVGRTVDLAAALAQLNPEIPQNLRPRIRGLQANIEAIRADLMAKRIPRLVQPAGDHSAIAVPILGELEKTVSMIAEAFGGEVSLQPYAPPPLHNAPPGRLFAPDAFTNPKHVIFGVRGGLAASICYITYSLLDWPGISTAVTTCFLTALSTIGSSHQKQALRISGALAGGAVALAAQIFILPGIDSITGFLVLFLAATSAAAWIITSGPRLSYFGVQFAYAFYLVHLSDFTIQTSLTPARDRVLGILLGLGVMWLTFDTTSGISTAAAMRKAFVGLLHSLAQFSREPNAKDLRSAIEQSYAVRETINGGFNEVRSLSDAVWFEVGPNRANDLEERGRILRWQTQLRLLFMTRITLYKYRLQLPSFELPEAVRLCQLEFDNRLADTLDEMADRSQIQTGGKREKLGVAFARLEETVKLAQSDLRQGALAEHLKTFLALSERIKTLAISLAGEI